MRQPFSQSRVRGGKGTAGNFRPNKRRAGFAAVGVYFYAWDDDEGVLASWAKELACAERGELVQVPAPRRRTEGPGHSGEIASES